MYWPSARKIRWRQAPEPRLPVRAAPMSGQPLRLLLLVPFAPRLDAVHGGARVIAQLIGQLASRHRIALCYLRGADEPGVCAATRARCEVILEVALPIRGSLAADLWCERFSVWGQVLAGKPLWAVGRFTPEFTERVRSLVGSWQPDLVQIEYHIMGQYLPALDECAAPRVLVQHEPGYDAAHETLQFRHGWLMPYLNWLAWQRFERTLLQRVQTVVVFTERDRRTLAGLCRTTPLVRIPLGAELPPAPLDPIGSRPLSLLFAGNYIHMPNLEAAIRLTDGIFPAVRAEFPETRLFIVGNHAPPQLQRRASDSVIVTGQVPDVTPYLDQAAVVLAPLRYGGGMRVKVLEALAAGKALVASRRAIEGLALTDGEQVVLAESDEEFSAAVVDLLSHPERRAALSGGAHAWASANLRWEAVADAYDTLYQRLIRAERASVAA